MKLCHLSFIFLVWLHRASGGAAIHQHSMLVQTSFDSHRDSSKAQLGPHITVINHDVDKGSLLGPPLGASRGSSGGSSMVMGIPSPRQLSRQGSSVESTAIVPLHHHTVECSAVGRGVQQPTTFSKVPNLRETTLKNEPPISFLFFCREALRPQRNVTSTAVPFTILPQLLLQLRTNLRRQQQQLVVKEDHPPPHLPYSLQWRPLRPQHRHPRLHNSNKRPENVHFPKVLTFDSHTSKWTELLKTMVSVFLEGLIS